MKIFQAFSLLSSAHGSKVTRILLREEGEGLGSRLASNAAIASSGDQLTATLSKSDDQLLDSSYRESELEAYAGDQQFGNIQDWEEAPVVSLREAAKSANPSNAYYGAACHCRKGCSGNQCSCRKAGKPCSTRCHSGRSCVNCRDSNPEREPMRMKISSTDSGSEISAPNLQPKRTKIRISTRCEEWFHKKCQNIPRAVFLKVLFCKECSLSMVFTQHYD